MNNRFLTVFKILTMIFVIEHDIYAIQNTSTHQKWPSAGYVIDVSKHNLQTRASSCENQAFFSSRPCSNGKCQEVLNRCDCHGFSSFPEIPEQDQKAFSWKLIWENVPPIDQGDTKACWSIASATAVDAARCISKSGQKCRLSSQENATSVKNLCACAEKMVAESGCTQTECSTFRIGCAGDSKGGFATIAMTTASQVVLVPEWISPTKYKPWQNGACLSAGDSGLPKPQHCANVDVNLSIPFGMTPEDVLKHAVYKAPVTVTINFLYEFWKDYTGGVFDNEECNLALSHVVVVTGWGEENGVKYWELRNSMGSGWGESGYFRIKRDTGANYGYGICGIAYTPTMGWF